MNITKKHKRKHEILIPHQLIENSSIPSSASLQSPSTLWPGILDELPAPQQQQLRHILDTSAHLVHRLHQLLVG